MDTYLHNLHRYMISLDQHKIDVILMKHSLVQSYCDLPAFQFHGTFFPRVQRVEQDSSNLAYFFSSLSFRKLALF